MEAREVERVVNATRRAKGRRCKIRIQDRQASKMLLTVAEVAEELRVSRITIKRWIKAGKLKGIRLTPHIIRIEEEEVDRFRAAGKK